VAAAEQMEVKMIDGLAAVFAGVDDDTIAFAEAFVAGNRGGCIQEMAEQVAVVSGCVVERGEVFTGNDENVDRRDRMNVGEGVAELVLVDGSGGNGTFGDLAEDAGHGVTSRASGERVPGYCWRSLGGSGIAEISGGISDEGSCREQV